MKRESKTKREMRKNLSKYSKEDLECLVDMHILFNDDVPRARVRTYHLRKAIAQEILESKFEIVAPHSLAFRFKRKQSAYLIF
jgi:hypothetical protein